MKFEERSYNSKIIRPKPLVYVDTTENFILMLTAWGATDNLNRVMENVKNHMQSVRQDSELTTPFQNILTLSDEANDLRVASLITNDLVFRGLNQDRYNVIIESCFINLNNRHVAFSHMGCPHILLKKKNQKPQPISCFPESKSGLEKIPLPVHFLGAEPTISPRSGDLYLDQGDEVILLSSSTIPIEIWSLNGDADLATWTDAIAASNDEQPFWLGRLKLD